MVRYTPIREIKEKDKNKLYTLLDTNPEIKYRIKIILLANDGWVHSTRNKRDDQHLRQNN